MEQIKLSPKQSEIVELNSGAFLVVASAGSGKTRVLTERIKRLMTSSKGRILAITFTNKAGEEIKDRIGITEKTKEKVYIGTFHSFCQSILEIRFKLLGYEKMPHIFEDDSDRTEIIEQAINDVPYFKEIYESKDSKERTLYKRKVLDFISTVKRELVSPEDLIEHSDNDELLILFETYQDILLSNNAIDFDDLILLIYKLLKNNESVGNLYRKSYEYICIDEAQDLNNAQYQLLKAISGNKIKNIMLVGDPNQSIYAFTGSSSEFMTNNFINDFIVKKYELDENYRCSKKVINASNTLISKPDINNYVVEGIFEIKACQSERSEAEYILNKIKALINLKYHDDIEGEITYNKIAILGRNKFIFEEIEQLLKINNIPYYFKSGNIGIKFSTSFMKAFDLYFRIFLNENDQLHLERLKKLLKVNNVFELNNINPKLKPINNILKFIDNLNIDNLSLKIKILKQSIMDNLDLTFSDEERNLIINEIDEFSDLWLEYQKKNIKRSLVGFKNSISLGITSSSKIKEGICLSTVHTMKGQEADIVFLIGMDEGTFPDYRAVQKGGLELQQEKNNAYVAFTKTKRFLYVTYPKTRKMPWGDIKSKKASRYIDNINI